MALSQQQNRGRRGSSVVHYKIEAYFDRGGVSENPLERERNQYHPRSRQVATRELTFQDSIALKTPSNPEHGLENRKTNIASIESAYILCYEHTTCSPRLESRRQRKIYHGARFYFPGLMTCSYPRWAFV